MEPCISVEAGCFFVDLRVIFHCARTKRIEILIDMMVQDRKVHEVPHHLWFAHFGKRRDHLPS